MHDLLVLFMFSLIAYWASVGSKLLDRFCEGGRGVRYVVSLPTAIFSLLLSFSILGSSSICWKSTYES